MNNKRRKHIRTLIDSLEDIKTQIEDIKNSEEAYLDDIPENLRNGEKAERAETALENLESAEDMLEEVIDSLTESTE